ncbi:unnamed protein product [Nippostrongylus brasiliensis]|uniref:Uncharacterized protein n=1 Tax=Nippostrongylus brasiliensis TaxID=27835 RepID=A0A0N4YTM7_NIPBR|nr:unnamed protein product [Nippostrongylus brasiliensis]
MHSCGNYSIFRILEIDGLRCCGEVHGFRRGFYNSGEENPYARTCFENRRSCERAQELILEDPRQSLWKLATL